MISWKYRWNVSLDILCTKNLHSFPPNSGFFAPPKRAHGRTERGFLPSPCMLARWHARTSAAGAIDRWHPSSPDSSDGLLWTQPKGNWECPSSAHYKPNQSDFSVQLTCEWRHQKQNPVSVLCWWPRFSAQMRAEPPTQLHPILAYFHQPWV